MKEVILYNIIPNEVIIHNDKGFMVSPKEIKEIKDYDLEFINSYAGKEIPPTTNGTNELVLKNIKELINKHHKNLHILGYNVQWQEVENWQNGKLIEQGYKKVIQILTLS